MSTFLSLYAFTFSYNVRKGERIVVPCVQKDLLSPHLVIKLSCKAVMILHGIFNIILDQLIAQGPQKNLALHQAVKLLLCPVESVVRQLNDLAFECLFAPMSTQELRRCGANIPQPHSGLTTIGHTGNKRRIVEIMQALWKQIVHRIKVQSLIDSKCNSNFRTRYEYRYPKFLTCVYLLEQVSA